MSKKEKVCLTNTQMEHIIDAAREKPGACPTAKKWLDNFRPEKNDNILLQKLDQYADKKVQRFIRDFKRWF